MSTTTETQTSTIPMPSTSTSSSSTPPEITILTRMVSIPLISSSLETINNTLTANAYTRSPYSTAKDLSTSVYKYTEPLQVRMAPLIVRADGYANKAVDVVEARFPYPFKAKPEEVTSYVRETRQSASDYYSERRASASKSIDDNVRTPAYAVAEGIDHRFAPIVDYIEVAVTKLNSDGKAVQVQPTEKQYQYQRAFALSKNLKDNIYVYSNDQFKQIQTHSVLVQRATDTAHSITNVASSSINTTQAHIHNLSDNMLVELQKLQASAATLSASLQSTTSATLHNSTSQIQSQIPPHVQQIYADFSATLSSTITDLRAILTTKDLPLQEKVARVGHEVGERVQPLLENLKKSVQEVIARGRAPTTPPPQEEQPAVVRININGHAN